jgi:hypothetical protein
MNIHFTVRLMMSRRRNKCHMLRKWTTVAKSGRVLWLRYPPNSSDVSSQFLERRLPEDRSTEYEHKVLRKWFDREEEILLLKAAHLTKETKKETRRTPRVDETTLHSFLKPLLTKERHPSLDLMYRPSRSIFGSWPPQITPHGETISNQEPPQFVDEPESPTTPKPERPRLKHLFSSTTTSITPLKTKTREDSDLVG